MFVQFIIFTDTVIHGTKYRQQFQENLAQRSNQNVKIARRIHTLNSKATRTTKMESNGKKT